MDKIKRFSQAVGWLLGTAIAFALAVLALIAIVMLINKIIIWAVF